MKKLFSLVLILLLNVGAKSQNTPNPYASIGKPAPKMVTLSNGSYDEFLLKQPLVMINSDAIDRKTNEMVYSKEENPEMIAKLEKEEKDKFRFLSVDPLTKQFPELTPYQYASNNPIQNIDIDGLEGIDAKMDGFDRQDYLSAKMKGLTGEQANDYVRERRNARGIGALAGAVVVLGVTAAPQVFAFSVRAVTWASANPEAAYTIGGIVGGVFYEGPEDLVPNSGGDEMGKYLRTLFKTPIADAAKWLKFAGVENFNLIKGSKGGITAVIGQGMDKVNKVAGGLKNAITFTPSDAAMNEWKAILKNANGGQVADDVVKGTKIFAENKAWINDVKKQGYDILDTGGGTNSTFYNMEKEAVYGEKK